MLSSSHFPRRQTRGFLLATFLSSLYYPNTPSVTCLSIKHEGRPTCSVSDEYKQVNNDVSNTATAQTCNTNFCIQ
jgi:hypothetical protein